MQAVKAGRKASRRTMHFGPCRTENSPKAQEVRTANDTVASYIACNLDNPIAAIPLKECKVKLKASHLYLGTVIYSPDHEAVLVLDTVDLHDTRRLAKFLGDFGLAVTPPK